MSEIENAKPIVKLLEAVRAVVDRDLELGLYQPDTLRLTIEARKKIATAMIEGGASERDAAKALGVDRSTIRRDAGKLKQAGSSRPKAGSSRPDDEPPDLPDQKTMRERYQRSLLGDCLAAIAEMSRKTRAQLFTQLMEKYGYGNDASR
jgi:Trp operon repressor